MAGTTAIVMVLLGVCAVAALGIVAKAYVDVARIRARGQTAKRP